MYRIRRAAELAGVTSELLRAWERRYGLVAPLRTEGGYRVYSDEDVRILRGAKRLVDGGRSIAEVAQLPRTQILEAALLLPPSPAPSRVVPSSINVGGGVFDLTPTIDEAIAAIANFDQGRLESALFRVMALGHLPSEEICEAFLLPLLRSIGDEWEAGRMSIAAEHFGSSIIRSKILRLIESDRAKAGAAAVVCACPAGEEHEGALLAFAVSASREGMRVIYLGADTPVADIIAAAVRTSANLVALSITRPLQEIDARSLVVDLERWRIGAPERKVVIGGRGAEASRSLLQAGGLKIAESSTSALGSVKNGNR